jgi:hypothetical protein
MLRQRRWRRLWFVGICAVSLLAMLLPRLTALAKTGTVRTKDGTIFQGDVTEDEKYVTVKSHGIATRIDKRNISADGIQYTASLDDQFNDRKSKLAPNDVKGRVDLANWATENQRPDLAAAALQEATKIDPANRDVALLLDTAQRQMDLDQRKKGGGGGGPTTQATGAPASSQPAAEAGAHPGHTATLEHRLLNADEINIIRQKEMLLGDPKVQIRFQNEVAKKFLATGDRDAEAFRQLSPVDQATEILDHGDPRLANDVRLLTDPTPLVDFKQKIYPIIASSCASTACHGGNKGGDFGLYAGEGPAAIYTNFYILQTYTKTINGVQYSMMDRNQPGRSLLLQFMLPSNVSDTPHPEVPNFRPRLHSRTDAPYKTIEDWLGKTLNPIAPNYGIKVSTKLPASQPSGEK